MGHSGERFPRRRRLTRGTDIQRVRADGARVRTSWFDVRVARSAEPIGRIGIVVPRYEHTAVERNLVKRRLRELARREILPKLPPVDVVLFATRASYTATFEEMRDSVRDLVPKFSFGS